ncbi:hypothetical protein GUJ93_ZPchr0586g11361 [Zizania palustris]|uniref:Uncharacterized protein n=1 Tax=Zizania palustris TaxID=103762 RepID=A0A8J5VEB4_ZIZPA|nr:hypothetical protein GUJ93_ZPchr0586g11361 [Zizania palustris]
MLTVICETSSPQIHGYSFSMYKYTRYSAYMISMCLLLEPAPALKITYNSKTAFERTVGDRYIMEHARPHSRLFLETPQCHCYKPFHLVHVYVCLIITIYQQVNPAASITVICPVSQNTLLFFSSLQFHIPSATDELQQNDPKAVYIHLGSNPNVLKPLRGDISSGTTDTCDCLCLPPCDPKSKLNSKVPLRPDIAKEESIERSICHEFIHHILSVPSLQNPSIRTKFLCNVGSEFILQLAL